MTTSSEKLAGVFLPITTPFNRDMRVDYGALKANLEFYAGTKIRGYLVLGSNGEHRCLSEEEKRLVVEAVLKHKADNHVVIVGCIYDATILTTRFMRLIKNAGADFATLISPSYYKKYLTPDVLIDYFTECAESVEIPVLLYNAPGYVDVTLSMDLVKELAEHPNIAGMKDSASGGNEKFFQLNNPDFCVLAGSIGFLYNAMLHDCKGGVASLGNAFPDAAVKLWEYGLRGEDDEGHRYQKLLKEANDKISGKYGVSGVKAAMDLAGLAGGYPRRPLKPLEGKDRKVVRDALVKAGLIK